MSRVSVLTPSFNQARFLGDNLASVRAQGPLVLEHIVVDGGSADGSRELLDQTGATVRWVSERDRGQAHALNKALAMARGEIIGWLNSDDLYTEGAVRRAVGALDEDPTLDMVFGHADKIDAEGRVIGRVDAYPVDLEGLLAYATIPQPSCFIRRAALQAVAGVDERFRYAMDYDLWLRLGLCGARWQAINATLARFRIHAASKSGAEATRFLSEVVQAMESALASPALPARLVTNRHRLRCRFHAGISAVAYSNLELGVARQHLLRAWLAHPLGFNRQLLILTGKVLLGRRLVSAGRALKHRLRPT
jgi:glycosyltransferase involved in cell wall biosynthesis